MDAIETAEKTLERQQGKPKAQVSPPMSSSLAPLDGTNESKIDELVQRKDIFSLICMLRTHNEKRFDSALALLRYDQQICLLRDVARLLFTYIPVIYIDL